MATEFQKAVWDAVASIPEGEVRTYGEVAEMAGYPGAARNVGAALEALTWWRVVRHDGRIADHVSRDRQIQYLVEEGREINISKYGAYVVRP